ncbi:nuclear transport factor 2 family protein [Chloroflexota bacterium]
MEQQMSPDKIRKLAKALDDAIEKRNVEELVSYFSDDCRVELLGIKLAGKEGLRKAIGWMFGHLSEIALIPITIIISGSTFFEEFILKAKVGGGKEIQVKQAEVLVYDDDYKVESLRLYFDRLEMSAAYVSNPIEKIMIGQLSKASLKGLL